MDEQWKQAWIGVILTQVEPFGAVSDQILNTTYT